MISSVEVTHYQNAFRTGEMYLPFYQNVISTCQLHKTTICPKSTTLLGWTWNSGTLRANPHRAATLVFCSVPSTVKSLRSFNGAYTVLSRVIPGCASILSPLDDIVAGRESKDIMWSESILAIESIGKP